MLTPATGTPEWCGVTETTVPHACFNSLQEQSDFMRYNLWIIRQISLKPEGCMFQGFKCEVHIKLNHEIINICNVTLTLSLLCFTNKKLSDRRAATGVKNYSIDKCR